MRKPVLWKRTGFLVLYIRFLCLMLSLFPAFYRVFYRFLACSCRICHISFIENIVRISYFPECINIQEQPAFRQLKHGRLDARALFRDMHKKTMSKVGRAMIFLYVCNYLMLYCGRTVGLLLMFFIRQRGCEALFHGF